MPATPASQPRALRVAAAQTQPVPGDIAANAAAAVELIATAATAGAAVVVFPELFLCGYDLPLLRADPKRCAVTATDPRLDPLRQACRDHHAVALVGACVAHSSDRTLSVLVVDWHGEVAATYDKQILWGPERGLFRPGKRGCTIELDGWRLGLGVCYELNFPEHARAAAHAGMDAYLCQTASSTVRRRGLLLAARAMENTCYVVLANHTGPTRHGHFAGHSVIYDPYGRRLADAGRSPGVILGDLDPSVLARAREAYTVLADVPATLGTRSVVRIGDQQPPEATTS
jgi:predicted amidohydrolase